MQITTAKQLEKLGLKKRVFIVTEQCITPTLSGNINFEPDRLVFTEPIEALIFQHQNFKK